MSYLKQIFMDSLMEAWQKSPPWITKDNKLILPNWIDQAGTRAPEVRFLLGPDPVNLFFHRNFVDTIF